MRTIEAQLYKFDELNEEAQQHAIDRYREHHLDYEWWDCTFEHFIEVGKCLGIEFDYRKGVNGRGEPTRGQPCIYFSGFCSQGDGACFEGDWSYRKGWRKDLKGYAPLDSELFRIGDALQDASKRSRWTASASTKHRGHYYHEFCMDVDFGYDSELSQEVEDAITEALRDFACWIYKRLEDEYEYLNKDETIREYLLDGETEYTEDGDIA